MSTVYQFLRFLVVGSIGLLVLLGVTYILTESLHWWYFWAYSLATLVSWTCIFFMNSFFTFLGHQKEGYVGKYALFISTYLFAFAINAGLVYSLTSLAHIHYLLSIIIATAITTGITFSISKKIIFTYER